MKRQRASERPPRHHAGRGDRVAQPTPAPQPEGSPVAFGGVVVVLCATIAAYWPTVASLLRFWNDYDNLSYTHGYLIAAISAWLVWRARHRSSRACRVSRSLASRCWRSCSVAWSVAYLAGIEVGHQALLPVLLLAAVAAFAGPRAAAGVCAAGGLPVLCDPGLGPDQWHAAATDDLRRHAAAQVVRHSGVDRRRLRPPGLGLVRNCRRLFRAAFLHRRARHRRAVRRAGSRFAADPNQAGAHRGRDGHRHELDTRRHHHHRRLPDRHAVVPGEGRSLLLWLGPVRRIAVHLLLGRAAPAGPAGQPAAGAPATPRGRGAAVACHRGVRSHGAGRSFGAAAGQAQSGGCRQRRRVGGTRGAHGGRLARPGCAAVVVEPRVRRCRPGCTRIVVARRRAGRKLHGHLCLPGTGQGDGGLRQLTARFRRLIQDLEQGPAARRRSCNRPEPDRCAGIPPAPPGSSFTGTTSAASLLPAASSRNSITRSP